MKKIQGKLKRVCAGGFKINGMLKTVIKEIEGDPEIV